MGGADEWTWGRQGVAVEAGRLLWYEQLGPVACAGGGASEQSFVDFLSRGPQVPNVPLDVLEELTLAVRVAEDAECPPRALAKPFEHYKDAPRIMWERMVRARHGGDDLVECLGWDAVSQRDIWESRAARDPCSACLAGDCYLLGVGGVKRHPDRAAGFYRMSVEQGDPTAMVNLAELLDQRGGPADVAEATALLRRAVDADDARAQGLLGKRYANGTGGVAKDPAEARRLFERGAEGGDGRSQNNLAVLHLPTDRPAAERLFRRAAGNGDPVAAYNLGNVLWETAGGNFAEPLAWFRRSAMRGYDKAQARLGQEAMLGTACPKDLAEARRWFLAAARQGHTIAQLNVGVMFEKGEGGPASFDDAELWFRKAAEAGNETAAKYRADVIADLAATRAKADPPAFRFARLIATGLPEWSWEGNYRVFTFAMPSADTVAISMHEDDGLTNGHAGMAPFNSTVPLDAFLADGPPLEVIEYVDLRTLMRVVESLCAAVGRAEPDWLVRLRFHAAALGGSPDVVRDRFLAGNPATIHHGVGGQDAVYWAIRGWRTEMVSLLLGECDCDPNVVYPNLQGEGRTALMVAILVVSEERVAEMLTALREGGADVECRNDRGETALLWLLGSGHLDGIASTAAFDWLLKAGADPNALRPMPAPHAKRGRTQPPAPPPWTPLYSLMKSRFLPEYKLGLACKLIAAGAVVAAMPESHRDEFRSACRTWGADAWTLGKSLGTRTDERHSVDSHPLFFRDAVAEVEVELCRVANVSWGFLPHAPDEHWSFAATLYAMGMNLLAKVSKFHDVLDKRDVEELWFESANEGRVWSACVAPPDVSRATCFSNVQTDPEEDEACPRTNRSDGSGRCFKAGP